MEQFNSEFDGEVKEKSIYLVHLDNTRIIILASVFVSVVALSFLIGMKLNTPSDELFLDNGDKDKVVESRIDTQDKDDLDALLSSDSSMDSLDSLEKMDDELLKEGDIVSQDKAENIVPKSSVKQEAVKKTEKKPLASVKKTQKSSEKKKVVAASVKKDTRSHVEQTKPEAVSKKGFSIQIGSFDTRSKAVQESAAINRMNYDSYIASATVKGKRFYRVKIGPFSQKSEAFTALNNLQSTTRYKDSYITFEK